MIKLDELLKSRGITQTAIANDTGITQPMINRYAQNKSEPNIDTLCKIADYFHISLDELVGRDTRLINTACLDNKTQEVINTVLNMTPDEVEKLLNIIKIVKS